MFSADNISNLFNTLINYNYIQQTNAKIENNFLDFVPQFLNNTVLTFGYVF